MASGIGSSDGGGTRWLGRLKKLYHKKQHSFGYIECVGFHGDSGTEDVYVYAMDLVKDLSIPPPRGAQGDCVKGLERLVGELFEFTPQHNDRGVKAMRPFIHVRGDFEGRREMVEALDRQRQEREEELPKMFTNLYVRNIPDAWAEEDVRELFVPYGSILSMVIRKDAKGRGRFGMVNMAEPAQADAAVSALHDCTVEGGDGLLPLYVQRYQKQSERIDIRCQCYVEQLREELASVLQSQAEAREDHTETLEDYLRWFALHEWNPMKAFAGASLGKFAELARQRFAGSLPSKAAKFAEGVEGVNVWKNKGSPFVYPSAVFKMLNRFGESDIEHLHKNPAATATLCTGCSCPRIVGREDPNDQMWRCVQCFIAWYGWYPWTDAGSEKLLGKPMGSKSKKGKQGKK